MSSLSYKYTGSCLGLGGSASPYVNGVLESPSSAYSLAAANIDVYCAINGSYENACTGAVTDFNADTNSQGGLEYVAWSSLTVSLVKTCLSVCCNSGCTSKSSNGGATTWDVNGFTFVSMCKATITQTSSSNTTFNFSASASGGTGTYYYQWYVGTANPPTTAISGATSSTFSYTVSSGSVYYVKCDVWDSYNVQVSSNVLSFQFVDNLAVVINPSGQQSSGTSVTSYPISATTSNGNGSVNVYIYEYNNGSNSSCPAFSTSTYTQMATASASSSPVTTTYGFDPSTSAIGYWCFYGYATDPYSNVTSSLLEVQVTNSLVANLNVTDTNINVGMSTNLYVTATGGSGNYSYTWTVVSSPVGVSPSGSNFQFYPSSSGTYQFYCVVTDLNNNGTATTSTVTVTVHDPLATSITPFFSSITANGAALSSITLTFTNEMTTAIAAGTQIMADINWSLYRSYLTQTCGNVRFFDQEGNPVHAWLESVQTSTGNNYDATSSVVWFLTNNEILGNYGSLSVVMTLYATDGSVGFDGVFWGEAPNPNGGNSSLDNGDLMFPDLYDGFYGTTLSSNWLLTENISGLVTVNNGLTIDETNSSALYAGITYQTAIPSDCIFEANIDVIDVNSGNWAFGIGLSLGNNGGTTAYINDTQNGGLTSCNGISGGCGFANGGGTDLTTGIGGIYWVSQNSVVLQNNYVETSLSPTYITSYNSPYPQLGGSNDSQGQKSTFSFARARVYLAQQPTVTFTGGYQVRLKTEIAGGSSNFNYTWYDGSNAIPTSVCGNSNVCYYSTSSSGLHYVYCQVTDTTTEEVQVTPISAISVTGGLSTSITPLSQSIIANQTFEITATVSGSNSSPNYIYSWYSNTTNTNSGGTALNIFNLSYSTSSDTQGTYYYYCVITDTTSGVSAATPAATVTIYLPQTATLTSNSSTGTVLIGNSAILTVSTTSGSGTFTYVWYQIDPTGSETILSDTGTSYTFSPASGSTTGAYSFFVAAEDTITNYITYSNTIVIQVYNFSVSITATPSIVYSGTSFTLYATVSGGSYPYSYTWDVSGTQVSAASSFTTSITANTTYDLTVVDNNGYSTTASYAVTVQPFVATAAATATTLINTITSQTSTLSVTLNPTQSSPTYQWYQNGSAISGATASSYTFSGKGTATGSYSLYCLVNGSVASNTLIITVVSGLNISDSFSSYEPSLIGQTNAQNNPSIQTTTAFIVYVAGVNVNAYNIKSAKTMNSAGSLNFTVPKNQQNNIALGYGVTFYYRNKLVFTGIIRSIEKTSTYQYMCTAYDGMWELAGVTDQTVTDTLSNLVKKYAAQTSMSTQNISGNEITDTYTINFGGKSVLQKLLELIALYNYNLISDENNAIWMVNYGSSPEYTITENKNFLVYSKNFNVVSQYGSLELTANVGNEVYNTFSGSGTPVHTIGGSWLSISTTANMKSLIESLGSTYLQGNWEIQLITFNYYPQHFVNSDGTLQSFQVNFADGTVLNELIPTGVQVQGNGVLITLTTYSDVIISILNTLIG